MKGSEIKVLGWSCLAMALLGVSLVAADGLTPSLAHGETESGVKYGVWGYPVEGPAPVLINLGSTIEEILSSAYFRQAGNELAERGYLSVSIDIPGHGDQHRAGEPDGLKAWRVRTDRAENFVTENNRRVTCRTFPSHPAKRDVKSNKLMRLRRASNLMKSTIISQPSPKARPRKTDAKPRSKLTRQNQPTPMHPRKQPCPDRLFPHLRALNRLRWRIPKKRAS